jgi:hypothetical protein
MKRSAFLLALFLASSASAVSVTLTTAQQVAINIPNQITVNEVLHKWFPGSTCDSVTIETNAETRQIIIRSGSNACYGKLWVSVTGRVGGNAVTRTDTVDVTITDVTPAALTAGIPTTKP